MIKARENQTPIKDLSRSKDFQSKKNRKVAKRSLVGDFTTISEDASSETAGDESCISEIFDADINKQLIENSLVLSPALSSTSEIAPPSHVSLTPVVNNATYNGTEEGLGESNTPLVEADAIINFLRRVQLEAPQSVDADNRHKKILEELIKVIIDEYCALPEETGWLMKLLSMKRGVVFLCFLTWSFVVCMLMLLVLFDPGCYGSDCRLPPT